MKFFYKAICILSVCLLPVLASAQENTTNNSAPVSVSKKMQKKAAKKKWKEEQKQKRIHKKEVSNYHKNLQTKEVCKRMRKDKRKATLNNEHKREFFLILWFSKNK